MGLWFAELMLTDWTLLPLQSLFLSRASRIDPMDPLSDVLGLLRPASYAFRGLDAGGAWALGYPAAEGIKCFAINSGECWLCGDATPEPVALLTGDVVMLPGGAAFRLGSAPEVEPIDVVTFMSQVPLGTFAVLGGGGSCSGVGGYFDFEGPHASLLLSMLPPVVHLRVESDKATLRSSIERLMRELRTPLPGGSLIAGHLAQALLIEALRLHLREPGRTGWLFALSDPQMNAALSVIHAEPNRKWTLALLAQHVGMSRSAFAARFSARVGEPPLAYLTRWRMMLGADRIAAKGEDIAEVALDLGYDSVSAFGVAFKRVFGRAPRQFAKASEPQKVHLSPEA
jgi:AraC-like DNA-binding protein